SFNGRKVLDGSFGNATFQVGANVGETISVGLNTSMKTADIGAVANKTGNVNLALQGSTSAGGAFTTAVANAAGQTYSLTVGGVVAFTFSSASNGDDVTAAEIDSGINIEALNAAGFTVSGKAAGGNLTFSRLGGAAFTISET